MVEKLIRYDRVAVIYSPGYGAGWSTWNDDDKEKMLFDPVLAQMILDGADKDTLCSVAAERYPKAYSNGLRKAVVEWLDIGKRFSIMEYDGSESIKTVEDLVFIA